MNIKQLKDDFEKELSECNTVNELLNIKNNYAGKKGKVTKLVKSLKSLKADERKRKGQEINDLKKYVLEQVEERKDFLEEEKVLKQLEENKIDITFRKSLTTEKQNVGAFHPRYIIQKEIEDIFLSMGFDVLDGPHVETEFYNFEALNIPSDHPARDMQDTFWLEHPHSDKENKHLLRTHTSSVQVHGMLDRKPPFRFIAPGIVFRCERTDASHEMVFGQLEGMLVDKNVSVSNLIYFMKTLLSEIFKKEVEVRLRPGFFPFVEPGFELDIRCLICNGDGCSVCKHSGWVELLPCGMVHPKVLEAGGIDSKEYNGFAFGLGLDRLVMMKYGIEDIRHLMKGDLRFNNQFKKEVK